MFRNSQRVQLLLVHSLVGTPLRWRDALSVYATAGVVSLGILITLALAIQLHWTAQTTADGREFDCRLGVMYLGRR